jgi:hypothetical protein
MSTSWKGRNSAWNVIEFESAILEALATATVRTSAFGVPGPQPVRPAAVETIASRAILGAFGRPSPVVVLIETVFFG